MWDSLARLVIRVRVRSALLISEDMSLLFNCALFLGNCLCLSLFLRWTSRLLTLGPLGLAKVLGSVTLCRGLRLLGWPLIAVLELRVSRLFRLLRLLCPLGLLGLWFTTMLELFLASGH